MSNNKYGSDNYDDVKVPQVLGDHVSGDIVRSSHRAGVTHVARTRKDVQVARHTAEAMAQADIAMKHAASASNSALTIATNAFKIRELGLNLWQHGERVLTTIEQLRLERDGHRQERFLLAQTAGDKVAIAKESLDRSLKQIQYGKIEDHADHLGRMQLKAADLGLQLKDLQNRTSNVGSRGAKDGARRKTAAIRTVADVAEHHVVCDSEHLYHPVGAIWYWGARRRGDSHEQASELTVRRLIDRMENDPISYAQAMQDMKKWVEMEAELDAQADVAHAQDDLDRLAAERRRFAELQVEKERQKAEAARERRRAAEVNFDTFAGGDVGDGEK